MPRFPGLRRLMRLDRGTRGVQRAVDDELRFHFDMTVDALRASGLDADVARREAERRFGDVARTRRRLETIDRARVGGEQRAERLSAIAQDIRYAMRGLRARPGFTAAVVATLGLGIGANATMFGIVDRLLFRPPAYLITPALTHKLYFATTSNGKERVDDSQSYARFRDIQRFTRTMDVVAAYSEWGLAVGTGAATREVDIGVASASLWRLFNARPALGRFFTADDDAASPAAHVVVLSYEFWQSDFGGARDVLGKTLLVGDQRHTIIGVTPPGFTAVISTIPAVFIPIGPLMYEGLGTWNGTWNAYNGVSLAMYARRRPDVSAAAASADISEAFGQSLAVQYTMAPGGAPSITELRARAIAGPILEQRGPYTSASTRVATWLLGVASIVLLIACANVGNLLLGRALARRREIAVRMALGISRSRLVGQLLIESALIAVFGAAAGIVVAQFGGRMLGAALIPDLLWKSPMTDTRVLLFAGACALTAGLLCGLAPIVQTRRVDVATALKSGAREGGDHRVRVRSALLVVQAGLSVVLLVGAGLFVRSMLNVRSLDVGFDVDRLLSVEVRLRGVKLDTAHRAALGDALVERARANPDVENASVAITVPHFFTRSNTMFATGDGGTRRVEHGLIQIASPTYFATTGTRVIRGRGILGEDLHAAPLVAVVSEQLAERAWPSENPLGKCVRVAADTLPCRRVVGVAADVRMINDLAGPPDPMLYLPAAQFPVTGASLLIRARGPLDERVESIRADLQRLMPGAGYLIATPIAAKFGPVTRSWRLGATMFAVFGGLALLLATIGLYTVVAYGVAQRAREMGVRIALGARATDIVSLIVGDGLRVVLIGLALGIGASLVGGRWIAPLLFKVAPTDPAVFAVVGLALLAVSGAASAIPALRATHVDATVALRAE